MIVEIAIAIGTSIVTMIVVGTVVKGIIGLRSLINWMAQTAALAAIATVAGFTTFQTAFVLVFPAVIHLTAWGLGKVIEARARRGDYGDEAKWAMELFEENDQQFIHAQAVLPKSEVREVQIIADSKQELRDLMIERHNELADHNI